MRCRRLPTKAEVVTEDGTANLYDSPSIARLHVADGGRRVQPAHAGSAGRPSLRYVLLLDWGMDPAVLLEVPHYEHATADKVDQKSSRVQIGLSATTNDMHQ